MSNVRLTVEYDGTAYSGWQVQKRVPTVEGEIERVLSNICAHPVKLLAAGRTDAGVHALGQVCSFHTPSRLPLEKMARVANQLLPPDIRITDARRVPGSFHATYDAHSKVYRYVLFNAPGKSVFDRPYLYPVRGGKLDLNAMRRAAARFTGTHDFSAFRGPLGRKADPVRTLLGIRIIRKKDKVMLEFHGRSFLHQMVRILGGTLLYVGLGKLKPEDIPTILSSRDRRRAGPTLPPCGLFLVKVLYSGKGGGKRKRETAGATVE